MLLLLFNIYLFGVNVNRVLREVVENLNDGFFNVRTFLDNPADFFTINNDDNSADKNNIPKYVAKDTENNLNLETNRNLEEKEMYRQGTVKSDLNQNPEVKENEKKQEIFEKNENVIKIENNNNNKETNDLNPQLDDQESNLGQKININGGNKELQKDNQNKEEINKEPIKSDKESNNIETIHSKLINEKDQTHEINKKDQELVDSTSINEIKQEQLNHQTENNQGQIESNQEIDKEKSENEIYEPHHYPYITSFIFQIKSEKQANPPRVFGILRIFFHTMNDSPAGRNGDYWEIDGKEANFTIRFEKNIIKGIELVKTNRSCEIKSFQILDTDSNYIILNTSMLKYPIHQFVFPRDIRTDELKLRVLNNQGDPKIICLKNYSLFTN